MADETLAYPFSSGYTPSRVDLLKKADTLTGKEREEYIDRLERFGLIPASGKGFFGELGKSTAKTTVDTFRRIGSSAEKFGLGSGLRDWGEEVLARNQQWNAPENPTAEEWAGGAIGCGLAYTWPILLFLLLSFFPRIIARAKRAKLEQQHKKQQSSEAGAAALSELEAGTPDKALWAQALVAAKGDEKTARAEYIKLRMKNPVK